MRLIHRQVVTAWLGHTQANEIIAITENIARVVALSKEAHIMLSFDGVEAAAQFENHLAQEKEILEYLIIIDNGLHRFGVPVNKVFELAQELRAFSHLVFKGIATHPGHVYAKSCQEEVAAVAAEEIRCLEEARDILSKAGFAVEIVATGSTPTAMYAVQNDACAAANMTNFLIGHRNGVVERIIAVNARGGSKKPLL